MSIVTSSITIIIGRVISIMISFVTGVVLARYLGAADRGVLSIYLYTISLVVIFLNAGIAESSIYLINSDESAKRKIIVNQVIYLLFVSGTFAIVGLLARPFFSSIISSQYYCMLLIIVFMLFNTLFRHYLLSGKNMNSYNKSIIIENIIYLALVFSCSLLKLPLVFIVLSYLIAQVVVFCFLYYNIKDFLPKIGKDTFNFSYIKKSYNFGLHLFFTGLGGFGLQRIGFYLLNYFSGAKSVGLFTIASTLPTIYENLPQQISTVAYTYISSETEIERRRSIAIGLVKLILYCLTLASLPLFLFAEPIMVLIFSKEYSGLGPLTVVLTASTILSGISGIFYNLLAGIGKPKLGSYLTIVNLTTTFITAFIFIFKFGLIGAAYSKLISSFVSVTFIGYFFCLYFKVSIKDILIISPKEKRMLSDYIRNVLKK